MWSRGGRAYYLTDFGKSTGYESIVAVDVDTGEKQGPEPLTFPAYKPPFNFDFGSGLDRTIAVDEAGRLFVATTVANAQVLDPTAVTGPPLAQAGNAQQGNVCVNAGHTLNQPLLQCVTGVSVLDAQTLSHVRHIPLRGVQADAPIMAPQLLTMQYSPPFEDLPAKLHLVVQESAHATHFGDQAPGARYNARNMHNVTYLVQMDPESGQQDWVVRLDACRGTLLGRSNSEMAIVSQLPNQAAVFRSRLAGDRAVYVGCNTSSQSFTGAGIRVPLSADGQALVPSVPAVEAPSDPAAEFPPEDDARFSSDRPYAVEGPDYVYQFLADPESGRIAMQVVDGRPKAMVWYIFDTSVMQFAGTVGIGGPVDLVSNLTGVSTRDGRLYTFLPPSEGFAGGLFVADIRRTPVPQALRLEGFAFPEVHADAQRRLALIPQYIGDTGTRLWLPEKIISAPHPAYVAIEDTRAPSVDPPPVDFHGRTVDLEELEGVTESAFDGVARGYGFRALLVAGADAAARFGPLDPVGSVAQCNDESWASDASGDPFNSTGKVFDFAVDTVQDGHSPQGGTPHGPCHRAERPLPTQCTDGNREVVLAFVGPEGPSIVDSSGARGAAQAYRIDSRTETDAAAPASRCADQDWEQLWGTALFGKPPLDEPSLAQRGDVLAQCVAGGETPFSRTGDAVADGYMAEVRCEDESASGFAYTRGGGLDAVTVAEAVSSFRIYRDPGRGIVSRVESVARGVSVDGVLKIDTVRGVAESWANGRAQPVPFDAHEPGYQANCDFERTAGTCFQRHLFGLRTPWYGCGPCGDEQAFVQAVNAVLNPGVLVRLREPDQRLRLGADNGFTAAIQKPEHERFTDLVLNTDLMQTVLPTLEIIRYAPPNRMASRQGARGRQIYQFAGVEVSSSYGIACLLVYDEEAGTCGAPVEEPGAITVSLQDGGGEPLAGGAFELREDVDADGVLGLVDSLLPDGACVTAEDGVGTCSFENLQPGSYLVSQVAAPPGYAKSDEPFVVELASGEQRTVAFTNVSNVSTIELTAQDENGGALEGATFAAYPDPDADGKVAPDAAPAATCTTGADGTCTMQVPAGSYVLVQTAAPGGLEGIEPVPFTFASGGQVAAVTVTNYPPLVEAPPPAPSPEIVYTPPVDIAPPMESVTDFEPVPTVDEPAPSVSVPERIGGTVVQVIRAPGDALRLLSRDPKQAVAWIAALALFVLAGTAMQRRWRLRALVEPK